MSVGLFLERLSMWNMLSCAEQVQIQKHKAHVHKTLKTVGVQISMLKQPTKHNTLLDTSSSTSTRLAVERNIHVNFRVT